MKKIIFALAFQVLVSSFAPAQYGYRWITNSTGTANNIYGILISNSSINNYAGFLCGGNGTFLVSTDGYNTWTQRSVGMNVNLYAMTFANLNQNAVLCCGDNGVVFYTTNAGVNWSQISTGVSARLNSIKSIGTSLFAAGDGGVLIKSTWSGGVYTPFTQISSGTTHNLKSIYSNGNLAAICGSGGTILKSTNAGVNWNTVNFPGTDNLNSVYTITPDIIVCGDNGKIFSSTNEGLTWSNNPSGVSGSLYNILSGSYIFGSAGTVLFNKYDCGGQYNWTRTPAVTTADLYSSAYLYNSADFIMSAGYNGTLLKRVIDTFSVNPKINANNIQTQISYRGIFDQYLMTQNTPGFEWPKGSGKCVVFTTGLSASCLINGQLAQTMCSYKGEYFPGVVRNGQHNDSGIFKPYKVSRSDNPSSPDWANWGCMVPYGAPYVDVNSNGFYEPAIDTPGVRNASQTLFICLTDINPCSHTSAEGFGGGIISPVMSIELHMTKWEYNYQALNDVVFTKFEVVNKGVNTWAGTRFAFVSDPDVGDPSDDNVGCDTVRNMGYAYNRDNDDQQYGAAPPAVGYDVLKGPVNKRIFPNETYNLSSFTRFVNCNGDPYNECFPNSGNEAYTIMKGFKLDGANWLDPTQPTGWGGFKRTKKIYYGDPETNQGWTAAKSYIINYGNDTVGSLASFEITRDKVFSQGMGADTYSIYSGDTATIWLAQLVARGNSNLNSVTKLKELSDVVQGFFDNNFTIGVNRISSEVPLQFSLKQNYPNPFNPVTKIKFDVAKMTRTKISVYDVTGRELKVLVNDLLQPGTYETTWDASGLSSGVYFYRLTADDFKETKKMALIK